jgi:hypothetical protein
MQAIPGTLIRKHAELDEAEIVRLRGLTDKEHGALLKSACEAAAIILQSRRASGLPDPVPSPWPESTWAFLKECAARARK